MEKLMFTYFMQLTNHTHDDANTPPRFLGWPQVYEEKNNVDIKLWDELVKYAANCEFNTLLINVGDGVRYDSHPEVSAPDAWSKELLASKLDEARALGLTPIPKLNFSTCHDAWLGEYSLMVGTKQYYDVCRDLIHEVAELFGNPKYFHLGMDEEYPHCMIDRGMCIVRNEIMFWHDMDFYVKCCNEVGARPWVWSDYYWVHPELFKKHMSKEIIQSNWRYSEIYNDRTRESDFQKSVLQTFNDLDELGYDQVPTTSTYSSQKTPQSLLTYCKEVISPSHLLGFATAPWQEIYPENEFALKNDILTLYTAKKRVLGDSNV